MRDSGGRGQKAVVRASPARGAGVCSQGGQNWGGGKRWRGRREVRMHPHSPLQMPEADPQHRSPDHALPGTHAVRSTNSLLLVLCKDDQLPQEFVV